MLDEAENVPMERISELEAEDEEMARLDDSYKNNQNHKNSSWSINRDQFYKLHRTLALIDRNMTAVSLFCK